MIDNSGPKTNNTDSIVLSGPDGAIIINKRDIRWQRTGGHKHHYLPDFSDETETYVALSCAVRGCPHGILMKKEGKDFADWLDTHRAKA